MVIIVRIKGAYWWDALLALLVTALQQEFMFYSLFTVASNAFYKD